MITIRAAQFAVFAQDRRRASERVLMNHLRSAFPREAAVYSDRQLRAHVGAAMLEAASYDLQSERDCGRFMNLALLYGWNFLHKDDTAWMHDWLVDPRIESPSSRLDRLVDECLRRRAAQQERMRLSIALGLEVDDTHDDDVRPEFKHDP